MPKNDWKRATQRARYGPVRKVGARTNKSHRRKAPRAAKDSELAGSGWTVNSHLWFGVHKNKPIKDVPLDYLKWLVRSYQPDRFWQMDGLISFLKRYIAQIGKG